MKGVLIDFWGTLMEHGIMPSPPRQVRKIMDLKIEFQDFILRFEEVFMTREYDNLNAGFAAVCEEFGVPPTKELLDRLIGMWNKDNLLCKPFPEVIPLLEYLKDENYKVALISNTPNTILGVLEKFDLEKYFDYMALSFEEEKLKHHPELFDKVLKEIGLEKDEVIMVGDSLESDIASADRAGIRGILVDRRDRRHHTNKVNKLDEIKRFLK